MNRSSRLGFAFAALVALFVPSAHATLLVYEGFNGYGSDLLAGKTPNVNTVGLSTSTAYYDTSNRALFTLTSGLSFGSLHTSGGALAFSASVANGTNVIGTTLTASMPSGSTTLWSSYLVRFSALQGSGTTDGALIRIGDNPGDSSESRFTSWADSRASSRSVGVGYGKGTANGKGVTDLSVNETYFILSKFTNVGTALSSPNSGEAKLWALTETQFANFIVAENPETFLDTAGSVTATASHSVTSGNYSFSGALALVAVNDTGVFDEIRFGTTLASVTPIPEPASAPIIAGLFAILALVIRRQRA